jgi:hypothetical protein
MNVLQPELRKPAPAGFHYGRCGDFQCRECAESVKGCFLYPDAPMRAELEEVAQ